MAGKYLTQTSAMLAAPIVHDLGEDGSPGGYLDARLSKPMHCHLLNGFVPSTGSIDQGIPIKTFSGCGQSRKP